MRCRTVQLVGAQVGLGAALNDAAAAAALGDHVVLVATAPARPYAQRVGAAAEQRIPDHVGFGTGGDINADALAALDLVLLDKAFGMVGEAHLGRGEGDAGEIQ